jgi:hypothetical protein
MFVIMQNIMKCPVLYNYIKMHVSKNIFKKVKSDSFAICVKVETDRTHTTVQWQ